MEQLPQHIQYEHGGTVGIDIPVVPAASQTVSCYSGGNEALFEDETATLTSIATTLSSAASRGDRTISVASASNIARGQRLWLTAYEDVLVKSVSETTVTLQRRLLNDHASAATVKSHRLSYTVSAASATTMFWDGRLEWFIDDGETTETLYHQPCISTKYRFYRAAGVQDWYTEEPRLYDLVDPDSDATLALDAALAEVVKRVAAHVQGRAWSYIGPASFVAATVFAAQMALHRPMADDAAERLYMRYEAALVSELERVTSGTAWRDADQDGHVEAQEQRSFRSGRVLR